MLKLPRMSPLVLGFVALATVLSLAMLLYLIGTGFTRTGSLGGVWDGIIYWVTIVLFTLGFPWSMILLRNVHAAFSVITGLWLCGCLNAVILYWLYRVLASRRGRSVAVSLNSARIEQRET